MTQPTSPKRKRNWHASDLRAAIQLAADASSGVTHIAEGVHQAVWSTLGVADGAQAGQTKGLTGLIYRGVTQITQRIANSLSHTLERLEPLFESVENAAPDTPKREAVLAALNGVIGDRLAASNNPLATKMTLRWQGKVLNWQAPPPKAAVTNKVLLLIHGLCMNDLQWRSAVADTENTHDHGQACADSLGYTPVYLRYNSGLHVSENGAQLAQQLQQLLEHWPLPIREISVLAHSMGGLVIRSALYTANQTASSSSTLRWPSYIKNIVFLGTPHHGAPLERAGNWIDVVLGSSRYTAPFARLGQLRSAGITDLRYGHVVDADWRGRDRFRRQPDRRQIVPLPEHISCYAIAATTAGQRSKLADRLIGDGLVPLYSALGRHDDPRRTLAFPKSAQWIAYRVNHMQLLKSPAVTTQIEQWLTAAPE